MFKKIFFSRERNKQEFRNVLHYFLAFAVAILYWEILLRLMLEESIHPSNLFFLLFVPAESAFFTLLCGFRKTKANRILFWVVMGLVFLFYYAQYIYFAIFGSLFSVSMIGMGTDAVTNFWWALRKCLWESMGWMVLFLVPVIAAVVLTLFRKVRTEKFALRIRALVLLSVGLLWGLAMLGLRLGGTGKTSAYRVFFSSLSDTDTTSGRFGAMTTTIIETGAYVFGIGSGQGTRNLESGDMSALTGLSQLGLNTDNTENTSQQPATGGAEDPEKPENPEDTPVVDGPVTYALNAFEAIDFTALKNSTNDAAIRDLCGYYEAVAPTLKNEYTGLFEGYNLIYICAESFWNYAIDEDITPTLYKMANGGIVLKNYYNSFKNTTTNGEYAFAVGLWPDVSRDAKMGKNVGSFPQSATKLLPFSLGTLFEEQGVSTYAYHNYRGNYYSRDESYPNLGYTTIKFAKAGMKFSTSWPASDLEMMKQSVDDYIGQDQFHAYYMTFSGHGPYSSENAIHNRNIDEVKEIAAAAGKDYNSNALSYLATQKELDKAMEYLLGRLEEAGVLDRTVIIIAADHYPYYVSKNTRKALAGHKVDDTFEMYQSSCIFYNAGLEEPIVTDTYCCNVDILPTVLNLFNIPYDSRLLAGTDIFSTGFHIATLYNKSFLTREVKYNSDTGEAEWLIDTTNVSQADLDAYLNAALSYVQGRYAASLSLMDTDFFRYVWEKSGLSK